MSLGALTKLRLPQDGASEKEEAAGFPEKNIRELERRKKDKNSFNHDSLHFKLLDAQGKLREGCEWKIPVGQSAHRNQPNNQPRANDRTRTRTRARTRARARTRTHVRLTPRVPHRKQRIKLTPKLLQELISRCPLPGKLDYVQEDITQEVPDVATAAGLPGVVQSMCAPFSFASHHSNLLRCLARSFSRRTCSCIASPTHIHTACACAQFAYRKISMTIITSMVTGASSCAMYPRRRPRATTR